MNISNQSLTNSKPLTRLTQLLRECVNREWLQYAACKNSTVNFFPNFSGAGYHGLRRSEVIAKQREIAKDAIKICLICPVRFKCEEDHKHEKTGVFYGTVPGQRDLSVGHHPGCKCIPCNLTRIYSKK